MSAIDEAKQSIESGTHPLWRTAVRMMFTGKTEKMGLRVEKVGLIVSYQNQGRWISAIVPLDWEKPYEQIASYCRETHGAPQGVTLQPNRSIELIVSGDQNQELEVAMFPVGLVFVGKNKDGKWADEVAMIGAGVLANIVGTPKECLADELCVLACTWASDEIRKLAGWSGPDVVTNVDNGAKTVIGDIQTLPTAAVLGEQA